MEASVFKINLKILIVHSRGNIAEEISIQVHILIKG